MSVTIKDLMRLPSLMSAKVVGGANGLSRQVTAVTVLEYGSDPSVMDNNFYETSKFYGSEIVITGFIDIRDNVDMQCAHIRRFSKMGEVGLILFYVGCFMPEVDPRLIELSNELAFPLICMPENRMDLRYSDVITEIMQIIHNDRSENFAIVGQLIEQITRLPSHQRTIGTMICMLRDRINASVLLVNSAGEIAYEALYPQTMEQATIQRLIRRLEIEGEGSTSIQDGEKTYYAYRGKVSAEIYGSLMLTILRESSPISAAMVQCVSEAVQLTLNIWHSKQNTIANAELARAVIMDEPIKTYRLAAALSVDIATMDTLWVVHVPENLAAVQTDDLPTSLKQYLKPFCNPLLVTWFDNNIVIFMAMPRMLEDFDSLLSGCMDMLDEFSEGFTVTICGNLPSISDVRKAHLCYQRHYNAAHTIFPLRKKYDYQCLEFARECKQLANSSSEALSAALAPLQLLSGEKGSREFPETLASYLLDADGNISKTAELLYVHKNTIKYRIARISDCLGFRVGDMPETLSLFRACAIERILGVR